MTELIIQNYNHPSIMFWGISNEILIGGISQELVERHRLVALAAWFADGGMEALVLGCTHFPYFKEALAARTGLPLVDPAEEMLRLLTQ